MNTGSVMLGRAVVGLMVCVPLPDMLNLMIAPVPALACCMAARRVQLPLPSSQTPSEVSSSAPSPVESTVWVAGNPELGARSTLSESEAMDSMAEKASALP